VQGKPYFIRGPIWMPANPGGRAAWGVGLLPLDCWDCGLESHWQHGCSSLVLLCVVYVAASATSRSLVQTNPTARVWYRNLNNVGAYAHVGMLCHRKIESLTVCCWPTFRPTWIKVDMHELHVLLSNSSDLRCQLCKNRLSERHRPPLPRGITAFLSVQSTF
jgi:hypothetical protein